MKKNKNILLILFISFGFILGIPYVYADDIPNVEDVDLFKVTVDDEFMVGTTKYKVTEVKNDEIYIGSIDKKKKNKLDIYHFEIYAYKSGSDSPFTSRKFVKLEELCNETYTESGKPLNICEVKKYKNNNQNIGDTINIQRQYVKNIKDSIIVKEDGKFPRVEELDKKVYYSTDHELGSNRFKSLLYVNNGKGSTLETDNDLDEKERGNFYYFGDILDDEEENKKFNSEGTLTGDVETLIDKNNNIYISLRFLSEALGARVDWLAQKIDNDTDAVLIRFYDSESYCKEFKIDFDITSDNDSNNSEFTEMYNKFLNETKTTRNDISFNLNYKYRDKKNTLTGSAKWKKLFLGGYAVNNGFVSWDADKKLVVFKSDASKPSDISNNDFQEICPSENYNSNGELESLDGCIEVIGLINYYGVPVPINLLTKEENVCKFDEEHFEEDDNYYDNDVDDDSEDDSDYGSDEYDGYDAIIIGDTHVKNISKIYDDENIKYIIVDDFDDFEDTLNEISEILNDDKDYNFVFNIGNDEIYEIIKDTSKNKIDSKVENLAKKYSDVYYDFFNKIEDNNYNVNINVIPNTPLTPEASDYNKHISNYNNSLSGYLEDKNIDYMEWVIDISDSKYKMDEFEDFEFKNNSIEYTNNTYKKIFKIIKDKIKLQ